MIYLAYQSTTDFMEPFRAAAQVAASMLGASGFGDNYFVRTMSASFELLSRTKLTHGRPSYQLDKVMVGNSEVEVVEEAAFVTPFGTLLHFKKDVESAQPRVLVVAPLSGHFATLLRNTVETLLPENDVYITDWHNARDVPKDAGVFGFDEYVDHVIQFLEHMGPGSHVIAVCQPCVQVLAAASVMAQTENPAQPLSMTLMAGPIDTRVSPTKVNELAMGHPIGWFEQNLISRVPFRFPGAMRRVYPGFLQLTAFMSMNAERHLKAQMDLYKALASGDTEQATTIKAFYDEYFAVLDMTAEFYLETVQRVFQEHLLAKGELDWKGRRINPKAIRRTALFTVEGERDDICALGQTVAAHDLCSSLRPYRKKHYMQAGVGHYGVFAGRRWASQIYPLVRNTILANE